jgi:hypothetical protein
MFVAKEGKIPAWSTVWFDSDALDAENGMQVSSVYPGTAREVRFVWRSLPISELRDEASVRDLVNAFLEDSSGALGEKLDSVRPKR